MCPGFYYLDICVQDLFKKVQALKLTVQQAHVTGLNALEMALGPKLEEHLNNHHEDYRITVVSLSLVTTVSILNSKGTIIDPDLLPNINNSSSRMLLMSQKP